MARNLLREGLRVGALAAVVAGALLDSGCAGPAPAVAPQIAGDYAPLAASSEQLMSRAEWQTYAAEFDAKLQAAVSKYPVGDGAGFAQPANIAELNARYQALNGMDIQDVYGAPYKLTVVANSEVHPVDPVLTGGMKANFTNGVLLAAERPNGEYVGYFTLSYMSMRDPATGVIRPGILAENMRIENAYQGRGLSYILAKVGYNLRPPVDTEIIGVVGHPKSLEMLRQNAADLVPKELDAPVKIPLTIAEQVRIAQVEMKSAGGAPQTLRMEVVKQMADQPNTYVFRFTSRQIVSLASELPNAIAAAAPGINLFAILGQAARPAIYAAKVPADQFTAPERDKIGVALSSLTGKEIMCNSTFSIGQIQFPIDNIPEYSKSPMPIEVLASWKDQVTGEKEFVKCDPLRLVIKHGQIPGSFMFLFNGDPATFYKTKWLAQVIEENGQTQKITEIKNVYKSVETIIPTLGDDSKSLTINYSDGTVIQVSRDNDNLIFDFIVAGVKI